MAKATPYTRTFNGRTYHRQRPFSSKRKAQEYARELRGKNFLARIVQRVGTRGHPARKFTEYIVYAVKRGG